MQLNTIAATSRAIRTDGVAIIPVEATASKRVRIISHNQTKWFLSPKYKTNAVQYHIIMID